MFSIRLWLQLAIAALLLIHGDTTQPASSAHSATTPSSPIAVGTLDGDFAVNANGAATYTIGIEVPPGTLGVAPELAIVYASQAPDGLLGDGFTLQGLSTITRCDASLRLDGYNGAVSFDANDRFCLDGQRLVKISGAGGYGAAGSIYHTENETWTEVRAEGQCGSGPCSFRARNKDGWTLLFGTDEAGVPLPGREEIASWQIASTTDLHGNRVAVKYRLEPERLQNLPIEIRYTENEAAGLQATRKVTFDYEPRAQSVPRYMGGYRFLLAERLKAIRTWLDGDEVLQYRLAYASSAGTGRDLISSIQQCNTEQCYPATHFNWQKETNALRSPNSSADGLLRSGWCAEENALVGWTDFNADGRADVHCDTPGGTHRVLLSTGSGLKSPNTSPDGVVKTGWCAGDGMSPSWIDFNGDTRADLACNGSDGSHRVLVSNGSSVSSPNSNADGLVKSAWCAGGRSQWGNFNADGRADLVCSMPDGPQLALVSTSSGVTSPNSNPNGLLRTGWCTAENSFTFWGDFNGDRLSDVHCATQAGVQQVLLSSGSQLTSPNSDPAGTVATGWCAGSDRRRGATDLNGDGLLDSYCSSTDGRHWAMLSTGTKLVSPNSSGDGLLRTSWCAGEKAATTWSDFNGDGYSDLQCSDGSGRVLALLSTGTSLRSPNSSADGVLRTGWCTASTAQSAWADVNGDSLDDVTCHAGGSQYALVHDSGVPDLVTNITNGIGQTVAIAYTPITDSSVYEDGDPVKFPLLDVRSPMQVVSRWVTGDGRGAHYAWSNRYRGARTDLEAQRWLGFQQVTTTDEATGRRTAVTYQQDYPVTSFITSTAITSASGALLARATYTPYVLTPYPNIHQVLVGDESNSTFTNGVADYTATKTYRYDEYGNRTLESDVSDPYYAVYNCQKYANDAARWRIGYATERKTTRSEAACVEFLASQTATWNPQTDLRWSAIEYDDAMNARLDRAWDDGRSAWVEEKRTFDAAGNAISRSDPAGNITTYTFDRTMTFPESETSPPLADGRALTVRYTYHRAFGEVETRTDANGNEQLRLVDRFGRLTEIRGPDPRSSNGEATVVLQKFAYGQDALGRYDEVRQRPSWGDDDPATWFYTRSWYDGMERPFREARRSSKSGAEVITETVYDTAGREWKQSVPHYTGTSPEYVLTAYDLLDRPTTVTAPDGTVAKTEYLRGEISVRRTEAFGTAEARSTLLGNDPRGLTLRTVAPNGGVTTAEYDPVAQQIATAGPGEGRSTTEYDSVGRAVKHVDPDRGTTTWHYAANGLLQSVTNGAGKSVRLDYDALLRPTRRAIEAHDGAEQVYTFAYDDIALANAQGSVTNITGPGFSRELSYSRYGLLASDKLTLDSATYITGTDYDPQGSVSGRTYADGSVLRTTRYIDGAIKSLDLQERGSGPFVNYGTYDAYSALGQPLTLSGGNGLRTDYTYYTVASSLARPHTTTVVRPSQPEAPLLKLAYTWNRLSEITRLESKRGSSAPESEEIARDSMGWITHSTGPAGNFTYGYDLAGNITRKDGVTYAYVPGSSRLKDASNGATFAYDGAGNLQEKHVASKLTSFRHDAAGRLSSVLVGGSVAGSQLYDSDDARIRRVDADGTISRYIAPDLDVVESNGEVLLTKYVYGVGAPLAAITTRYTPQSLHALLSGSAARERDMYDRGTRAGLLRYAGAGSRALMHKLRADAKKIIAAVLCAFVMIMTLLLVWRRRGRGDGEATIYARRHPLFTHVAPLVIGALLLFDATAAQGALAPGEGYPVAGTRFFHSDQVESTLLVTDAEGNESSRVAYDPFGAIDEKRSSGPNDFRPKFAAKERDFDTQLDYFGARYYDNDIGRFLEPDPESQFAGSYTYANNDPADVVDPDGRIAFPVVVLIAAAIGAVAGSYFGGASVNHGFNPFVWDWGSSRTLAGIFAGAGIGAVGGALGTIAGSAGVAVGIGAEILLGAAEGAAFTALGGGSQKEILESALMGGLIGGVTAGAGAAVSATLSRAARGGGQLARRAEREILSEADSIESTMLLPCTSFPAGTLVATANDLRPIESISAGAKVLARESSDAKPEAFPVLANFSRNATDLVDIDLGATTVRATAEHPFWVDGKGWTPAASLAPDDRLVTADDERVPVQRVEKVDGSVPVFNFRVGDAHTYFVSPLRLLVHNPATCTRGARARALRHGVDPLNIIGGRRPLKRTHRFGSPISRYGPAAPMLPGGRFVDFRSVAWQSVRIRLRGTNPLDFAAADAAAGINKAYRQRYQLTWHHVEDLVQRPNGSIEGTLLLVPRADHRAWPHWGGEWRYRQLTGGGYGT